jgi:nicotinamidase-related amidase
MEGNLGYDVTFVADATRTFDPEDPDGSFISAADIARSSAASLHGEFAMVATAAEVLAPFADSV